MTKKLKFIPQPALVFVDFLFPYVAYRNRDGFIELYKSSKNGSTEPAHVNPVERIVTNATTLEEASKWLPFKKPRAKRHNKKLEEKVIYPLFSE